MSPPPTNRRPKNHLFCTTLQLNGNFNYVLYNSAQILRVKSLGQKTDMVIKQKYDKKLRLVSKDMNYTVIQLILTCRHSIDFQAFTFALKRTFREHGWQEVLPTQVIRACWDKAITVDVSHPSFQNVPTVQRKSIQKCHVSG